MRKVLLLSPYSNTLEPIFEKNGDDVHVFNGDINQEPLEKQYDQIVSFGYRYIIKPDFLRKFLGQIYNIHISALPWNRGADPNFWSVVDTTPSGVSIHEIDEGLDTGKLIHQKLIFFADPDEETLASTYNKLQTLAIDAFAEFWILQKQTSLNSAVFFARESRCHKSKEKNSIIDALPAGWDTTLTDLVCHCRRDQQVPANWACKIPHRDFVVFSWNLERAEKSLLQAIAIADLICASIVEKKLRDLYNEYRHLPNVIEYFEELAPTFTRKNLKISDISDGEFNLRIAGAGDSETLFNWRNDEITRRNCQKIDLVTEAEHKKWFSLSLCDPMRLIYIAEYKNQPVGMIRLDSNDDPDSSKLYWTVNPEARNKSFGSKMLHMISAHYRNRKLIAPIRENDIASIKMAAKCGFKNVTHINGVETWVREVVA